VPVYVAAESYKFARCLLLLFCGQPPAAVAADAILLSCQLLATSCLGCVVVFAAVRGRILTATAQQQSPRAATPFICLSANCTCRLFPLNQRDLPLERKQLDFGPLLPTSAAIDNPSRDYTPPQVKPFLKHKPGTGGGWVGYTPPLLQYTPPQGSIGCAVHGAGCGDSSSMLCSVTSAC
jgi:hypothetical protein